MTEDPNKKDKKESKQKLPWWKRIFRIFGWIIFVLFVLFFSLVFFIRSPWGQNLIVDKLTDFVSEKTQTKVEIDKLFITFTGNVDLRGLYLEDTQGDTLIYSKNLQVAIPFWPIIRGNPIAINGLKWSGLRANVVRKDSVEGFNFQFLIDAFASDSPIPEKDTSTSKPPKISVGSIDFSDFKLNFDDEVTGMKANLDLGRLHLQGKNIDLENMKYQVSDLVLENTKVTYIQSKNTPSSDTTESTLPYLGLDNLKLKNVTAYYKSVPDSMEADARIVDLQLQAPKVDLAKQDIEVGHIILNNSNIQFKMNAQNKSTTEETPTPSENPEPFNWPDWNIKVEKIAFENNHLHFQLGKKPNDLKTFDPNYIVLNNFNFKANDISLTDQETAKLHLQDLSFNEASGITLKQLDFSANLTPKDFSLDDLRLKSGSSSIHTDLSAEFTSLQQLIDYPEESPLALNLKQFVVDLNDVFLFQPELKENVYLEKLSKNKFNGEIKANGKLSQIELSTFIVNWGEHTEIKTHGNFSNLDDFDKFALDIENFTFNSTRSDLTSIISEEDLGISIPKTIAIESQINGRLDDLRASLQLSIPEGKVNIDGEFVNKNEIAFSTDINVIDLDLGKILKNSEIGKIAFEMKANGKGNTINELNAKLVSNFSKLEFNGYDFSALELDGKINNGEGDVNVCYRDHNLDLKIDSEIQLDSVSPQIKVNFELEGADLHALGFTDKEIKTKLMLKANFKGNSNHFEFGTNISEGVVVHDENNYYLGPFDVSAKVTNDSTSMDIKSEFLNGKLRANAGIDSISNAIQHHLEGYFKDSIAHTHNFEQPVKLQLNMKLSDTKILSKFLLPEIKSMDTLNLNIDFDQEKEMLSANLSLPYFDYADKTIDSLQLNINSTENEAIFKFGFNELNAGPFVMHKTFINGDFKNEMLRLNFNAFDGEKETYIVGAEISGKASDLKIHFDSEKLMFHGENWSVPNDNLITIKDKIITAENFILSHNNQSLTIANDLLENTSNNIGLGFKNFKLSNLLALFNKDDYLASGEMQGNIVAIDPLENFGLNADFSITNLEALQAPLGKLTLKAKSDKNDNYNLDLAIKGDDIDIALKGDYAMKNVGSELDFKLDLNKVGMKTIAIISDDNLKDASGNISGELLVNGSTSSPEYKGRLQFNNAAFNVSQLNAKFDLSNDEILIDNEKITLKQFSIEDSQKNNFTLDGSIFTEDFSNPVFDLNINAENFQALNSKKEDNDVFYGDVNFDMEGTIKGDLSAPKVNMTIGINEKTDFTYAIQSSQAKIEKRDGIVEFVNKENPDDILTRTSDSSTVSLMSGIELNLKLKIDKGANFNVIVDPQTGDDLNISGVGALDFNISKTGQMSLTGRYDINDGHYNLSLYNLVKRKFELERGSSVIWRGGEPLDAELNVTAKYKVEASASGLMAAQTAGASEEVQNRYRQKLPFLVFLNVKGEIDQPILNFNLDMPEDARGAIDGTVYGRIKQVNSEDEEVNKQVFSLLVLKKFYPSAGSDGSDGGAEQLVRKKVNEALSDQLNAFSSKLMGNTGVELDFGLNSYTDYQGESVQQRTDLNISAQKKLLDDRLIVQVGSNVNVEGGTNPGEENPIVGNASIQYLLTEDGRWRLKGFRNNEFENVIDGQVYVNGISVIFQRQFNMWKELFVAPTEEKEKTEGNESDKENDKDNDTENKNSKRDKKEKD